MSKFFVSLIALVAILSIACQEKAAVQQDVGAVLADLESKFEWLDYRLSQEQWELYTTGESDSLNFFENLYGYIVSDPEDFQALKNSQNSIRDEEDKRRHDILYGSFLTGRVENEPTIAELRDSLSRIDLSYRAQFEGEKHTANYLYQTYRTSRDRSRRELAYRAYVSVGEEIADGLAQLMRLRNQEARRLGYNNYLGLVFSQIDLSSTDYLALLRQLDTLSKVPYERVLEKAKGRLNIDYPEIWDIAYSFNSINSRVDRFFPIDSQLVYIKNSLKAIGFNLEKLPIYYDLESRPDKSQFAYAFTIKAPYDMRVLANQSNGHYSTTVLMHEIGHTLHSAFVRQDNDLFNRNFDGFTSEAMGQLLASMTTDPTWLAKYAHMPPDLIESFIESNREEEIIYLRTTLHRLQFEYEAYQNPNRDLNQLYWDLFEKYMMLPRHEELRPWASIIHYTTHPIYLQYYLYADMITAQALDYIDNNYEGLVDRSTSGAYLMQNFYRFGSRYSWRSLVKRATDNELSPEYYLKRLALVESD